MDLIAYLDNALGHHCPLCFFLEFESSQCPHKQTPKSVDPPISAISDLQSYASATSDTTPANGTNTIKEKASDISSEGSARSLKRKSSPTGTTLRELRTKHSRQSLLRAQKSDDRLRQKYESQMQRYLESPLSDFSPFGV